MSTTACVSDLKLREKEGVPSCSEANSRASFGTILDDGPGGPIATPSGSACRRRAGGCGRLQKSVFDLKPAL